MKREPRIVMAKEVLRISDAKVVVDYDFRNDSDDTITTEVAFPIPAYGDDPNGPTAQSAGFDDFKLWIDGKPFRYQMQVRAFVGKHDITDLLTSMHIDAASFGHEVYNKKLGIDTNDLERLSRTEKQRLMAVKAIDCADDHYLDPLWSVQKKYHWTQTFPPRSTVHIRHEYTPVVGGTNSVRYGLEGELPSTPKDQVEKYSVEEIKSVCLEPALKQSLLKLSRRDDTNVPLSYVDFILTTANTWKTPIEDFTLIVDRPPDTKQPTSKQSNKTLVSFCWKGPVEHPDSGHFTAHTTNFVPTKELRIGFVHIFY